MPTEAPRRYGVTHEDFDPEIGRRLIIRCDGVEQKEVVEYDCDQGFVLRNKLNDQGEPQIDPDNREHVWRETITGTVTAELAGD